MTAQTCDQCGASVAADEQFCPTCGAFVDPMTHPPAASGRGRRNGSSEFEEFELGAPPPSEIPPTQVIPRSEVPCPSCGASNPAGNRHCEECGARLSQGPLPTAPRPAVQASAGVRAAFAISALLFGVVLLALLFSLFRGGDNETSTTDPVAAETTSTVAEIDVIPILRAECNLQGISGFVCGNLIGGSNQEYQVVWQDLEEGEKIIIKLTFREPMHVTRIDWTNISDTTRFARNYRARGIVINSDGILQPQPAEIPNEAGTHQIRFAALDATSIEITIETAWPPQVTEGDVFRELAIDEIQVLGRPSISGTDTEETTTTPAG